LKIDNSFLTSVEKRIVLANITVDSTTNSKKQEILSNHDSSSPLSSPTESLVISSGKGKSKKNRKKSKRVVADWHTESIPAVPSSPLGNKSELLDKEASEGGSSGGRESPDTKTSSLFESAPSSFPSPLNAADDGEGEVVDDGNELRRKIERLKEEAGSRWMSAYGEAMVVDDVVMSTLLADRQSDGGDPEILDSGDIAILEEDELNRSDVPDELDNEEVDVPTPSSPPPRITVDSIQRKSPIQDPSEFIEDEETSIVEPDDHLFSIPKPRMPKPKAKSNIPQIGPYRKLFEFPDNNAARVKFDRIESGSASMFPGLEISTPIVAAPPPLVVLGEVSLSKSAPTASLFRVGGSSTSGSGIATPPLYLSRPVDSDGGVKYTRSNSTFSVAQSSLQSFQSSASSMFTGELCHDSIPRTPSIPLRELTNSLRLYLQFNVFNEMDEGKEEEILHWYDALVF
jgi:hypothetical protein